MMMVILAYITYTHTPQRVYYSRILDHQVFICFYAMCELTTVTRTKGETLPYRIEQVIHIDIDMYTSNHSYRYRYVYMQIEKCIQQVIHADTV
jgi:hypothetical protein